MQCHASKQALCGGGGCADPALRLKDKTVDEILNQWSRDLEEQVTAFTEQALRIRQRDVQLIDQGQKARLTTSARLSSSIRFDSI